MDPDDWRDFELNEALGILPGQADDLSAARLDRLIAIKGVVAEWRRERQNDG